MAESDGTDSPLRQMAARAERERLGAQAETASTFVVHGAADSRGRQLQQTVSFGALGGGILLAGFGLAPALVGMMIGAGLGYWYERHAVAE